MFYEITAVIIVFLLIIISLIVYIIFSSSDSKSAPPPTPVPEANNKVCLSIDDYNVLLDKVKHNKQPNISPSLIKTRV
jgi:hypothetical protein